MVPGVNKKMRLGGGKRREQKLAPTTATLITQSSNDAYTAGTLAKTKAPSKIYQPSDTPEHPQFPFFTQTVSLYLPLHPAGWSQPCTAAARQHLEPRLNRYVPELKGVLLDFRNVAISTRPGREGAATNDREPTQLIAVGEFGVGYGWVTVDVDLFAPYRGAWMEGTINLENEGYVGVVCTGNFNASIAASRLPPEWRWVHFGTAEAEMSGMDENTSSLDEDGDGVPKQPLATGRWVDGQSKKVEGRVRFRIKSFDAGVSGKHGYLSIEGTMLDRAEEKAAMQHDREEELTRRRGKSGGLLVKERRRVPDFSFTRLGKEEDEEENALHQDIWKTTQPESDKEFDRD